MANLSVKSTRYTLKELKNESPFFIITYDKDNDCISRRVPEGAYERAENYLVFLENKDNPTGSHQDINYYNMQALENLRMAIVDGIANDKAKYCLPESYKTELTWTINARSLQNFLSLRSSKSALWEIRDLADEIFESIPDDHKFLFEGNMNDN